MKETLKEIALDIASAVDFFLGSCVCACVRVRVFVVFVFGVCAHARALPSTLAASWGGTCASSIWHDNAGS